MRNKPEIMNVCGDVLLEDDSVTGHLALKNVVFSYPEKMDVVALNDVSFEVNNHDKRVIALVGGSGCGKSSCIAMLQQFYLPLSGTVEFNGRDIREINSKWYHSQVAIVQQEPILFQDTIRNNILYGIEERHVKGKENKEILLMLDEACKQASVYEFIKDKKLFPDGYETLIGPGGVQLSGGQKQRVAIARALVRKPKVLLLDEATSALDTESEHQVQLALNKLIELGKQTVVIVAHRLSTVKDADEIIVFNKGVIVERGNHDHLVGLNGAYKKLVERQLVTMEAEKTDETSKFERMETINRQAKQVSMSAAIAGKKI
jgi:ATP-binding cassette subfamily B (MDR/TAP) protein 1